MGFRLVVFIAAAALCPVLGGCSVLTASQTKEVQRFADATQNYGDLPGSVIAAYAEADMTDRLLGLSGHSYSLTAAARRNATACTETFGTAKSCSEACTRSASERAFCIIEQQQQTERATKAEAAKADAALKVLDAYAQALSELASDDLSTSVDDGATEVGKSLDSAIKGFNEVSGQNLALVGSIVAQAVAAGGRLYIRNRQSVLLREYVIEGDKIVPPLTDAVIEFAANTAKPEFESLRKRVAQNFTFVADASGRADLYTLTAVDHLLNDIDDGSRLADSVARSAAEYRAAHAALAEAVREKRDLKSRIEQITTLAKEIQAARKLRSEFKS